MSPTEGYGPADAGYSGSINPAFASFDNRIRYNDMIRRQMISQYQQSTVRPATMTLAQQRRVATDPRHQYGVSGGQDPRMYQRQATLSRQSYGAALTSTVMDIGGWEASAAATAAAGIGGFAGTIALPLGATLAAGHFLNKGVDNAMERQRFMHSIAGDVEQYRGQLGFDRTLSYGDATNLGRNISSSMKGREGFFNTEQMARIHKIGLSNKMLSAKGGGIGMSGSFKQYEKNVEELTETTEEVVKLLQTTIEGGMSVMKELQQTGFGSMRSIRNQVRQAKSLGAMTGMGSQNMIQVGAAGARAVQGTPWEANVGATMYQSGAAQASYLSRLGPEQAYSVQRAGGVAAAGGAIARTQMNVLSSGMGTAAASYAMNADGSIDNDRMGRLLSGAASGHEIVTGGARRGYEMGVSGRVLFERNKADMLNNMSDMGRGGMVNRLFEKWGAGRGGNMDAKSWAFAGQFTNNQRDQRVFAASLLNPKGYEEQWGSGQATKAGAMDMDIRRARYTGPMVRSWGKIGTGFNRFWDDLGEGIVRGGGNMMTGLTNVGGNLGTAAGMAWEMGAQGLGLADKLGVYNRATYGDSAGALRAQYGIGQTASRSGSLRLSMAGPGGLKSNVKNVSLDLNFEKMMVGASQKDLQELYQKTRIAVHGGTADTMYKDPTVMRMLNKYSSGDVNISALMKDSPIGAGNYIIAGLNNQKKSINALADDALTSWDKEWKANDTPAKRAGMSSRLYVAKQATAGMTDIAQKVASGKMSIGDAQGYVAHRSGIQSVLSDAYQPAMLKAFSGLLSSKTDLGPESHMMIHDVERAKKEAESGLYGGILGFGYKKEMATTKGEAGVMFATGGLTERGTGTGGRKKAFRKILEKYTDLKGEKQRVTFGDAGGQKHAYGIIQNLIAETSGEDVLGLKGELAQLISNGKNSSHHYFGTADFMAKQASQDQLNSNLNARQAANIRGNKAELFGDYLRKGLGRKVSDNKMSFIKGIFTEQTSDAQIKALSRGGSEDTLELLSSGLSMPTQALKEMAAEDPSKFRSKVIGSAAAVSHNEKTALQKANTELIKWQIREKQLGNKASIKVEDGDDADTKKDVIKREEIMTKMGQAQLDYDMAIRYQFGEGGRSKESYANVQPPIMNYWNNRWSL